MAAQQAKKPRKKSSDRSAIAPWLAVLLGLAIAAFAAFSLLSGRSLETASPIPDVSGTPAAETHHDRDQIDEESRQKLRDILRAAGNDDGE